MTSHLHNKCLGDHEVIAWSIKAIVKVDSFQFQDSNAFEFYLLPGSINIEIL